MIAEDLLSTLLILVIGESDITPYTRPGELHYITFFYATLLYAATHFTIL